MVITIFPTFAYQKKTDLLVGGGVCTEITSRSITLSALTICVSAANCGHKKHTHVLPEVLCIFLQSAIGQELIYRYVVGSTGIINIYDDDIAKIPIPILDGEIQKDIAEKVQNSFALRRQSKQLLEYAKQAVEMAIEQGEDAALVWLKERSGE